MSNLTILSKPFFHSASALKPVGYARLEAFLMGFRQNPDNPGRGVSQVQGAIDPGMWIAKLSAALGVILHQRCHQRQTVLTLLFVGPVSEAESWARRHRIEPHPKTGAIQLVAELPPSDRLQRPCDAEPGEVDFSGHPESFLVALGIPPEWASAVRAIRDEDDFWAVFEQMPEDAAEYLYALYLGEEVTPPKWTTSLERNLDNLRWMYLLPNDQTLEQVLERPFEDWMFFLHPTQRRISRGEYDGPIRVTGSAGTGKTVLAVHRARHLASLGKRVLLTTFTRNLTQDLEQRVRRLCYEEEVSRITVGTVDGQARRFACKHLLDDIEIAYFEKHVKQLLLDALEAADMTFPIQFLMDEWRQVIDLQGIETWNDYQVVDRTGRGNALQERQRAELWTVFVEVLDRLANEQNRYPLGLICRKLHQKLSDGRIVSPFDAVIVDEVQDLGPRAIQFLAALCGHGFNGLMVIGDAGQRIYRGSLSLLSLGIDTRGGRSKRLQVNYRTTREIETAARLLRSSNVDDLQGGSEIELAAYALRRGPHPVLAGFAKPEQEQHFLLNEIQKLLEENVKPLEIGVFARYRIRLKPFHEILNGEKIPVHDLKDSKPNCLENRIRMTTLHGAKGLEFRYVFVVGCELGTIPSKTALDAAEDDAERQIIRQHERNLLYVAMTRARDKVWLTWNGKNRSEFLRLFP